MKLNDNALLVEDERRWSEIYERAVRRVGFERVTSVTTFADAEIAVDAMRFAVAVVDIGLHVDDDRNVDGLRVMEKIRAVGDRTSIIVVTGRGGRDVVPIVRDAIIKYDAHDTVAKSTLVPAELRELVASGQRAYELRSSDDRGPLLAALRGGGDQMVWEDTMLREAVTDGGAAGLRRLIDSVFTPFLPLVPGQPKGVQIQDDIACGVFWSRGIGEPIVACFGAGSRIKAVVNNARASGLLLGKYSVGNVLGEYRSTSTEGVVYALLDRVRTDFEDVVS